MRTNFSEIIVVIANLPCIYDSGGVTFITEILLCNTFFYVDAYAAKALKIHN